jgi:hypothetical protein
MKGLSFQLDGCDPNEVISHLSALINELFVDISLMYMIPSTPKIHRILHKKSSLFLRIAKKIIKLQRLHQKRIQSLLFEIQPRRTAVYSQAELNEAILASTKSITSMETQKTIINKSQCHDEELYSSSVRRKAAAV